MTAAKGDQVAGMLVGPVRLEIQVVNGTRCYFVRASDGTVHGVIWPYGTTAVDGGLDVPGLAEALMNGDVFWAGGGGVTAPQLGVCDKGPALGLGEISRTLGGPSGGGPGG